MLFGIFSCQRGSVAPPVGRTWIINTTTAPGAGGNTISVNGNDNTKPWYGIMDGDTFEIAGGTYNSVSFSNMSISSGQIKVKAKAGESIITQEFNTSGSHKNVLYDFEYSGLNSLLCRMTSQRCFHLDKTGVGGYENLTFRGIDFKTHSGYTGGGIFIDHANGVNIPYGNGSGVVSLTNVKFENISFEAPSAYNRTFWYLARIGSEFSSGSDGKFNRGVQFVDVRLIGFMEVENAIHISNAEQALISYVRADGVNQNLTNPPHFRLLFIRGQGIIERSYFRNYSGNIGCIWGFNRLNNDSPSIIRNCMGYNSRVYSVAEIQGFSNYIVGGVTKAPPYKLLNLLADTLDTARQYSGCAADVYNLQGGTLVVKNCVSINGHNSASGGNVTQNTQPINNMSGITINHTTNKNFVFANRAEAGVIAGNYRLTPTSPLLNNGITDADLLTDYYGDARGATPSIGAVQNIGEAPALVSIAVTPSTFEINEGQTQQLVATGTFDDDTTEDITSIVSWSSSSTGVATVNSTGLVSGVSEGTATITATLGEISGTSAGTINEAPVLTANWVMGINFHHQFGGAAATGNWNNPNFGQSATRTNLKSMDGVNRNVGITIGSGFDSSSEASHGGSNPISQIYATDWWGYAGSEPGIITFTGLNAAKKYKIKLIGSTLGDSITKFNTVNNKATAITFNAYPTSADLQNDTNYVIFEVTGVTSQAIYHFTNFQYFVILGAVIIEFD